MMDEEMLLIIGSNSSKSWVEVKNKIWFRIGIHILPQRWSVWLRSGLCAEHSSSFTQNWSPGVYMELDLYSGVTGAVKGLHQTCWSHTITYDVFAQPAAGDV